MGKRRIRILFTISNFYTAGSGKVVYDLINGLNKNYFDIEIACESTQGVFFKEVEKLGIPIHVFETKTPYRPYTTLIPRVLKISKFYKANNYDIVHSWHWSSDWTSVLAARFIGVKWIYTKKAMGANNKHWRLKNFLSHFIITINDEMHAYFPNKKQQALIPIGIDTRYYSPETLKDILPLDSSCFHIITVANLVPVKGLEVLLKAIKILNNSKLRLTVLGDFSNDYGQSMFALSREMGLDEQVTFLGKHMDVRPYIASSDLYVIPTLDKGRKEGMPMALVEAMSMGIPVLGSNITGIKFVLKDFKDLLFQAGDAKALALKISKVQALTMKERQLLGKSLRAYCETHFTMEAFISAHETLYKSLVKL
ncbi:glycosyltransferase [Hanstruepera flava]|uniref:glycosyltransferase n=1 Tax=Hanstruepera flava TaxID=2930218 RepID=UPI0020282A16|nr:glycosyltransferase [Hanstruepera flava]